MKLLLDMNVSPRWLALLQGARIEATHWASLGPREALDSEIMDLDPDVIGAPVIQAVRKLEAELDAGALVSVTPSRSRVRLLPLKTKR